MLSKKTQAEQQEIREVLLKSSDALLKSSDALLKSSDVLLKSSDALLKSSDVLLKWRFMQIFEGLEQIELECYFKERKNWTLLVCLLVTPPTQNRQI